MKLLRLAVMVLGIVAISEARAARRDYLTPSEALAQATDLDGKTITIGGVVDLGTNSRCLYDSLKADRHRQGDGAGVITLSEGAQLLERRAVLNHRFVLVTGTFKKAFNGPDVIDLYQCSPSGIEQESITLRR